MVQLRRQIPVAVVFGAQGNVVWTSLDRIALEETLCVANAVRRRMRVVADASRAPLLVEFPLGPTGVWH